MKALYNMKISTKVILFVSIIVIVGVVVLSTVISHKVSNIMINNAKTMVRNVSEKYAIHLQDVFSEISSILDVSGRSLEELISVASLDTSQIPLIFEVSLQEALDSEKYARYSFIYLLNAPKNFRDRNPNYTTNKGNFVMLMKDSMPESFGGVDLIKGDDNVIDFPVVQRIKTEMNVKKDETNITHFGKPTNITVNGETFKGINIAVPLYDNDGFLFGIMGFVLDTTAISDSIIDTKNNVFNNEIRILSTQDGVILTHTDSKYDLKNIRDVINNQGSQEVYDLIYQNKDGMVDRYVTTHGKDGYASINSFKTLEGRGFSFFVSAPTSDILAQLSEVQVIIMIVSAIALIAIIILLMIFLHFSIGKRLPLIVRALDSFFKYVSHDTTEVHHV